MIARADHRAARPMGLSVLAVAPCCLLWPESVIAQYWVAGAAAIFVTLDVSRIRVSAPGLAKLGWELRFVSLSPSGVFARPQTRGGAELLVGLLVALGTAAAFGTLDVWLYAA